MWLLHIVAIHSQAGWQSGLVLWAIAALAGGGLAYLAGEWQRPDALLVDLLLAAGVAALVNAFASRFGTDLLAVLFGVRVFWSAFGAAVALALVHDGIAMLEKGQGDGCGNPLSLSGRGGFRALITWLSGWPSEPGMVEASYDGGLGVKLLPEALHYQVRAGPFAINRVVPLLPGLEVSNRDNTLIVAAQPGTAAAELLPEPLVLAAIAPPERATALAARIEELLG